MTRYLLVVLLACSVGSAGATTFTVTKTADTADGECGADCSLREAVSAANMKDGADEIVLPAGTFQLTREDEDGEPYGSLHVADLNAGGPEALTIRGAGMTSTIIEQTLFPSFSHVLAVNDDHDAFVLEDLTLRGGYEDNGACLYTRAPATIERVTFTECQATEDGGAYRSSAPLTMRGCVFEDNFAGETGGALLAYDASTITDTVFRDNDALGDGGAILGDAPLTLERVTFSSNRAGGNGGALLNYGLTTATNVTFSNNQAGHVFSATTTTTTTPSGSTTTTTVSGCGDGDDLRSLLCRVDELIEATDASADLGTQETKLAKAAEGARKLIARGREKCGAGGAKAARKAGRDVKKAGRKLVGYKRGLTSNTAKKQLDESVRATFVGKVEPLIAEVKSLRGSLVCPDDATPAAPRLRVRCG